ncbi:MAG: hypothetical protein ACNYPE_06875 [Candidatus Azotimanducaceae bacterium WSBS_2022_MAG_OTU7]
MKVVDLLHNAAGTTGMRSFSPLERKLRDSHQRCNMQMGGSPALRGSWKNPARYRTGTRVCGRRGYTENWPTRTKVTAQ